MMAWHSVFLTERGPKNVLRVVTTLALVACGYVGPVKVPCRLSRECHSAGHNRNGLLGALSCAAGAGT